MIQEFELVTREFELLTLEFQLLIREFELVTHGFELITCVNFDLYFWIYTRAFKLTTRHS